MSWGTVFLFLAAIIFLALGFNIVEDTGKIHMRDIGWGLTALGIMLGPWALPINLGPRA